jgi:type IV pilus assembly protein PilQ
MIPSRLLIICVILLSHLRLAGQNHQDTDSISNQLDSLALLIPALNERVDFTVNELPLSQFIRGVANQVGLNVNLDPNLNQLVSNNFTNVKVKDLLVFLQENYNIRVRIIGNILDIKRKTIHQPEPPKVIIDYSDDDGLLSIEVNGVQIDHLAREITRQTGKNVIVTPGLDDVVVRSYIQDVPFESALEKMAVGNNFKVRKTDDGFFLLEPATPVEETVSTVNSSARTNYRQSRTHQSSGKFVINAFSLDSIDIKAEDGDLAAIVIQLFDTFEIPYQFLGEINESVTIDVKGTSIEKLLDDLFAGCNSAFRRMKNIYWFGPRDMIEMQEIELVQMKYRTIDSLIHIIPDNMKKGVEIIEYPDLNSLILAGPTDRLLHLGEFLDDVDRAIPVILIEVMIIDNKDTKALTTGITAGIAEEPVSTSGTVLPSVDMTLSSDAVNDLIDGFNGFGWVNLGKVTPDFYMKLQALEEDGFIEMRSTPQLSTMNGHKATMSIGNTEYYKEERNVLYGTVTSSSQKTTTYKPVEAELKLEIRPLVAGNQEVTLNVLVEQSDFTERIEQNAPPGKVSRKFESIIRVKDQEMILLGGLEEASDSDTRSGVPFLARIPVINWLFSSKSKTKSKSKLNIFIKPIIIN